MKILSILRFALIVLLAFCLYSVLDDISFVQAQGTALRMLVWSWSAEVDEALDRALAEFEDAWGLDIELIRVSPQSYWGEVQLELLMEERPDILWIQEDIAPLVEEGGLIELDGLVLEQPEVLQEIPEEALESFRYGLRLERHLYGIPLGGEGAFAQSAYGISTMAMEAGTALLAIPRSCMNWAVPRK